MKEFLCIDSPEGQASEEDETDGLEIGTKDTLSFSWRALKESRLVLSSEELVGRLLTRLCFSSLLHATVVNPAYGPPNLRLALWIDQLWSIGSLAFTQLAELRHRGAFSTVSSLFAACCILCVRTRDARIRRYPNTWYQVMLPLRI